MHSTITHVIFDLDGTLLDTESAFLISRRYVCSLFGKQISSDLEKKIQGAADAIDLIIEQLELPITAEQFRLIGQKVYEEALLDIKLMPGAQELVQQLANNGYRLAIATGSSADTMARKVANFPYLFTIPGPYFSHAVAQRSDPEVKRAKPEPDVFRVCADRFDIRPVSMSKCLVFEDSVVGVEAAVKAGMRVVHVPSGNFYEEARKSSKAHCVIKSLKEFDFRLLD